MDLKSLSKQSSAILITSFMLLVTTPSYAITEKMYDVKTLVTWHINSEDTEGDFYKEATFNQCFNVVKYYYKVRLWEDYLPHNYISVHHQCAKSELQRQDQTLNKLYQEIQFRADNQFMRKLQQAQRKWLKYRDAHCNTMKDFLQINSSTTITKNTCLFETTRTRNKELDTIATYLITE